MTRTSKVALVGATASGKSDLALALASQLRGEVVNADSMQVYQGMDIGTAKLTVPERQGIPHHLLDIWPVTKQASLAEYQELALRTVEHLSRSGSTPLLVGGSGLYVQSVVDRWRIPGTDANVRSRLAVEMRRLGVAAMYSRLQSADPEAASAIDPNNERRIVRALEVVELEGSFLARLPAPLPTQEWVLLGLDVPREVLDERIGQRVHQMWDRGLVKEVQVLVELGLREGVTASRALGYAQVLRFLAGEISEEQARSETLVATRRFARRQLSWFRRDPRIAWLPAPAETGAPDLVAAAKGAIASASA